jgi:hypothetical protein
MSPTTGFNCASASLKLSSLGLTLISFGISGT